MPLTLRLALVATLLTISTESFAQYVAPPVQGYATGQSAAQQQYERAYAEWYERNYGRGRRGFQVSDETFLGLGVGSGWHRAIGDRSGSGVRIVAYLQLWLSHDLGRSMELFLVPEAGWSLTLYSEGFDNEHTGNYGFVGLRFAWGGHVGDLFVVARAMVGYEDDAWGLTGQLSAGAEFHHGIFGVEVGYSLTGFPAPGEVSHALNVGAHVGLVQLFMWMADNL